MTSWGVGSAHGGNSMRSLVKRTAFILGWIMAWRMLARAAVCAFAAHCTRVAIWRFMPLECELLLELMRCDFALARTVRQLLIPSV